MSYQVFARKWRPQSFSELVGQNHVMTALTHALNHQRLHHAYLFTGTRGVGKTTIARIFAKCLSCETGITANPCGQCDSCTSITAGRYIDLLEVDAASRTKVEDTRDLLENVQYAPTQGRFKIYLIDEVHMLTTGSFNALLKTLEEPPEHVKFLLATTDPQKLPVTVLSRCLQFNLKRMPIDMITSHLESVLTQENIPYHISALRELARAADGSMRDALSLLDQAVAFGQGRLDQTNVQEMLGGASQHELYQLLQAIAAHNGKQMLAIVEQMANHTPDYELITDDLISLLHQLAVQQIVPQYHSQEILDEAAIQLAQQISAEDLQLYYQIALQGRADLAYAPDPRCGFEMLLLRMLAFRIAPQPSIPQTNLPSPTQASHKKKTLTTDQAAPKSSTALSPTIPEQTDPRLTSTINPNQSSDRLHPSTVSARDKSQAVYAATSSTTAPQNNTPLNDILTQIGATTSQASVATRNEILDEYDSHSEHNAPVIAPPTVSSVLAEPTNTPPLPSPTDTATPQLSTDKPTDSYLQREDDHSKTDELGEYWHQLLPQLALDGMTNELARHGLLREKTTNEWQIALSPQGEHFHNEHTEQALLSALQSFSQQAKLCLKLQVSHHIQGELPVQRAERIKLEQQQHAEQMIRQDTFVNHLINTYNAVVIPHSITCHPNSTLGSRHET
ncbi:MAG: DNA polymerase III subunit gamma/tau [bacterium]